MLHMVFEQSDSYPVALLIKTSAFKETDVKAMYVHPLNNLNIPSKDIVAISLEYNENDKAPVKHCKAILKPLLEALDSVGTKYIYCADANYFKVLTKAKKAEPNLGYSLPCAIEGYEHFKIVLGINYKAILHNPAFENKLTYSLETLASVVENRYLPPGKDIIHCAHYPATEYDIENALRRLFDYEELACDIEGFSLDFQEAGIGTIAFAWDCHNGIAFAVDYKPVEKNSESHYGKQRSDLNVERILRNFFVAYKGKIKWHKAQYDLKAIICQLWMMHPEDIKGMLRGLDVMCRHFDDTHLITYLATNTTAGNKLSLKELAQEFAGDWGMGDSIKDIRKIPLDDLLKYNLIDALCTNWVYDKYMPKLIEDEQLVLYQTLMLPSLKVMIQMEMMGMPLNPERVVEVKNELTQIKNQALQSITGHPAVPQTERHFQRKAMQKLNATLKIKQHPLSHFADLKFNPGSSDHLRHLLYEELLLPVLDYTDTGLASTKGDVLKMLVNHCQNDNDRQLLAALVEYSKAGKILSTFIPAFERAIAKTPKAATAWLRGNFSFGPVSGRLSSSDPNLQNIPAGSTHGKLIKSCFRAPKNVLMVGADFNSLEDYASALTTKDPNKLKVYTDGYDSHCLRAFSYFPDQLPGIIDTVDSINSIKAKFPAIRQASKMPTFALQYQGTRHTLTKNLGLSIQEARAIEKNYHELYKVSDAWVADKLEEASQKGYVTVAFGLRLRTPLLAQTLRKRSSTPHMAEAEGRTAGNALGQSYGLLTNRAAVDFMQKVWKSEYRHLIIPIAMIHDAIYLLVSESLEVIHWVNEELIKSMQWQELPELKHDTVKLGAELSVFHPTWANEIVIPNKATPDEIEHTTRKAKA